MSQGHPDARDYPIGFLATETEIARGRVREHMAGTASLVRGAMLAANSKKAAREFDKLLEKMSANT